MLSSLKHKVQRFVQETCGYTIQKYSPPGSDADMADPIHIVPMLVEDVLKRTKREDFLIVQIGAHDGLHHDPVRPLIKKYHFRSILVEPQPKVFKKLVENYKDEPQLIFENVAISGTDGQATLYAFKESPNLPEHASMLASFSRDAVAHNAHGYTGEIIELHVPALSLATLLAKHKIQKIHYLQLDTEGFDFQIIKMLTPTNIRPEIICFESNWLTPAQMVECHKLFKSWNYRALKTGIDTVAYQQRDDDMDKVGY